MKRVLLFALLVSVLSLAGCRDTVDPPGITYTKPYRLEGTSDPDTKGGLVMTREFIARKVYYAIEPRHIGYPVYMRMVDANGLDLPNPVWGAVDPEVLEFMGNPEPNLMIYLPLKKGTVTVSAVQDNYEAKADIVVLPIHEILVGKSFDFDGDSVADFIKAEEDRFTFLYGAAKTNLTPIPDYLADVPVDFPTPVVEVTTFENGTCSPIIAVCNSSGGNVYAVLMWIGAECNSLAFRKLR